MTDYASFLHRRTQLGGRHGFEPLYLPDQLFDWQKELTSWAIREGRGALLEDCGLGKSFQQLVWAQNVHLHTGKPVLVLAPLAVTHQTTREASKFGMEAAVSRDGSIPAPITVTNYDRLHYFDREYFAGLVCDESSAIKSFDGQRRALVTEFMRKMPYRLLCTATAAPNDYIELGTSSEALGELGYMDMLGRFFRADNDATAATRHHGQQPKFRLKGHAEVPYWRWVSSWARAMRRPSDYGYSDDGYDLPELIYRQTVVTARTPKEGQLFETPAYGLQEEREETKRTINERCEAAADLLAGVDHGIAWCHLNAEGDLLTKLIDGAVQVSGSDDPDVKEERLSAFSRGEIRVLVSKPVVAAWGMNWEHCNRMTFFPSHSYEQAYQAVRRCWRFGQTRPVTVDIVTTEGGIRALANIQRKAEQADRMFDALVTHMRDALTIDRSTVYDKPVELPTWMR